MRLRNAFLAAGAVAVLLPAGARAQGIEGRWSLSLQGGTYKMESSTLQVGSVAGLDLDADFADYKLATLTSRF